MVEWTGAELSAITYLWGKIYVAEIGTQALKFVFGLFSLWQLVHQCCHYVKPQTGTVMVGLENAVKNNIKQTYLRVDPDNFRVCAFCVASKFGPQVFAPDVQMTWQTFLAVVVSALGKQYH
uniref:Globin domain-containing protein n=1 Tax=Maylandia zebra TaxID=106582 RepID=A0A3P9D612_9CICH